MRFVQFKLGVTHFSLQYRNLVNGCRERRSAFPTKSWIHGLVMFEGNHKFPNPDLSGGCPYEALNVQLRKF